MKLTLPLTLVGLALLAGCDAPLAYTPLQAPPRAMRARPAESVEVLDSAPHRAFTEVARVDGFRQAEHARVLTELRAYAAALGCDAIVVRSVDTGYRGEHGYKGTCVMYTASSTD